MGDLKVFQERFIALRQRIVEDGLARGLPLHPNDLRTIAERLSSEGTSFVKVTLPLLGKALDQGLVCGQFSCPAGFRLRKDTRIPVLLYSLFSGIFQDSGAIRDLPDVSYIAFLRQFLLLDAKLRYEPPQVMKDLAVTEFSTRMENLRKFKIQVDHPVLTRAKTLIGRYLKDLDLSDIRPGHGPGAVAERIDRFGRWDFLSWPSKAEKYYPYLMYGTASIRAVLERGRGIPLTRECLTRCCLVPKDFKGPRLISAESAATQYLQQGQMAAMMRYVQGHRILGLSIRLQDQTYNQKLAKVSYANGMVTLDLSNASDTVSVPLFWYLFSEVPQLRRYLMATRSDFMLYAGKKIKITSFAPMGSATCFPVETIIFWALAFASIQVSSADVASWEGRKAPSSAMSDRAIASRLGVFGDDIILPDYALDVLIGTLESVGCTPNMSKTCYRTPFRESCGSEWYAESDVTIIRNKRYSYATSNVVDVPVLCDLQRKFFAKGYYRTASLLAEWCNLIAPIPVIGMSQFLHIRKEDPISKPWLYATLTKLDLLRVYDRIDSYHPVPAADMPKCLANTTMLYHETLDYVERQSYSFDRFPCLLGFSDDRNRSPIRYNKDLCRYEARVPIYIQSNRDWVTGGYPRLLARLLCDQTERIAIRDLKVRMAWVELPFSPAFTG